MLEITAFCVVWGRDYQERVALRVRGGVSLALSATPQPCQGSALGSDSLKLFFCSSARLRQHSHARARGCLLKADTPEGVHAPCRGTETCACFPRRWSSFLD